MQKSYALFDFDGTLIRGDSIVRFCLYMRRRGLARAGDLPRGLLAAAGCGLGLYAADEAKRRALAFLAGREEAEVRAACEDFCREVLAPMLRPDGVNELAARAEAGDAVLLVTASPAFYLEPLTRALPLEGIIGTRLDARDGRYTGLVSGRNCRGVEKPLRLAEYLAAKGDRLDYERSSAYGDSPSDLPMLSLCKRRVLVNPGRRLLAKAGGLHAEVARWPEPKTTGGETSR